MYKINYELPSIYLEVESNDQQWVSLECVGSVGNLGTLSSTHFHAVVSLPVFAFSISPLFPEFLSYLPSPVLSFFTAVFLQQNREEKRCLLMQMGKRKHSEMYFYGSCPSPTFASCSALKKRRNVCCLFIGFSVYASFKHFASPAPYSQ